MRGRGSRHPYARRSWRWSEPAGSYLGTPRRCRSMHPVSEDTDQPGNSRKNIGPTPLKGSSSGDAECRLSALLADQAPDEQLLSRLIHAWPTLTDHIRAAIRALLDASRPGPA